MLKLPIGCPQAIPPNTSTTATMRTSAAVRSILFFLTQLPTVLTPERDTSFVRHPDCFLTKKHIRRHRSGPAASFVTLTATFVQIQHAAVVECTVSMSTEAGSGWVNLLARVARGDQ